MHLWLYIYWVSWSEANKMSGWLSLCRRGRVIVTRWCDSYGRCFPRSARCTTPYNWRGSRPHMPVQSTLYSTSTPYSSTVNTNSHGPVINNSNRAVQSQQTSLSFEQIINNNVDLCFVEKSLDLFFIYSLPMWCSYCVFCSKYTSKPNNRRFFVRFPQ